MAFTLETIGELIKQYWWIFVIIGILILFYIYSKLDPYTKHKIGKFMSGTTFLVVIFFAWWMIWAFWIKGDMTIRYAHYFMPLIGLILLTTYFWLGKLRYETPQVVTPNFHASISEPPKQVNGFLIYGLDTISAGGIHWPYAERVLVVREETAELLSRGSFSIANTSPVLKFSLPPEVVEEINRNPHLKKAKEFYYGWFDDVRQKDWEFSRLKELEKNRLMGLYGMIKKELKVNNPKISTLLFLYQNQSKAINKQGEYYDATIETVDKGTEHFKRVKDVYSGSPEPPPQKMDKGSENY